MKKIFGNAFLSLIYYSVNLILNMWITSVIIFSLGKGVYSFYPLANNISGWMVIITSAVNAMLARHIAISLASNNVLRANKYYTTALVTDVFLTPVLLFIIIVISMYPDTFFTIPLDYKVDISILLFTVLLTVPINMLFTVPSISWTAKDKVYLSYIDRLVQSLIKFGIIYFAYYNSSLTLPVVGYSILISDGIYSAIILLIKKKIMPEVRFNLKYYDFKLIKIILKSGIWNSLMQLGNSLLFQCDLFVSNIFLGIDAAGIISIVTTIPNAITSIVTLLCSIFMPEQYKAYGENDEIKILKSVKNAQFMIGTSIGILIVVVINFGKIFFDLWVPGNNSDLLLSLSIFYLGPLIISATFRPVANISIVMDKMKFQAIFNILNGFINVIGMIFLINLTNLGIYSIVITTAAIVCFWYAIIVPKYISKISGHKVFDFYRQPLINLFFFIISNLICIIIKIFLAPNDWLSLIFTCMLCILLSLFAPGLFWFKKRKDFM